MRAFKFRAWHNGAKEMLFESQTGQVFKWYHEHQDIEIMQFTGLLDKNGKEIYEGDIFRIEEDGNIDEEDRILYTVVVWIKEWCMFATLLDYEYHDYIENGVKAIDEGMFWTYTLEDTNSNKHFLCGNIYQDPELL